MNHRRSLGLLCASVLGLSCQSRPASLAGQDTGPDCETRRSRLVQLLEQLPAQAMSVDIRVGLPTSRLGGALGRGPILEIGESWVALDGVAIEAASHEQAALKLEGLLRQLTPQASAEPQPRPSVEPIDVSLRTVLGAPGSAPTATGRAPLPAAPVGSSSAAPVGSSTVPSAASGAQSSPTSASPAATSPAAASPATTSPGSGLTEAASPASAPPPAAQQAETAGGDDEKPALYIAAERNVDMRTLQAYLRAIPDAFEPKLLFGAPPLPEDASLSNHDLAARVFAERDPAKRKALAMEGYTTYSTCDALNQAVKTVDASAAEERWPRLQQAALKAVPECACESLDAERLGYLFVAEQRAGGVAIGSLPVGFLEDERCTAAMPLRSVQQVLRDIETFEEEFSGAWQSDALHFEDVLTNERLQTYLCVALPGETLASMQRLGRSIYFKAPGGCQRWEFQPLSPGAPMGTLRRQESSAPLAFHYRQYGEDIRLFGPVLQADSKPTDEGPWECSQDLHFADVDEASIGLAAGGRWFFSEAACKAANATTAMPSSCVSEQLSGP